MRPFLTFRSAFEYPDLPLSHVLSLLMFFHFCAVLLAIFAFAQSLSFPLLGVLISIPAPPLSVNT